MILSFRNDYVTARNEASSRVKSTTVPLVGVLVLAIAVSTTVVVFSIQAGSLAWTQLIPNSMMIAVGMLILARGGQHRIGWLAIVVGLGFDLAMVPVVVAEWLIQNGSVEEAAWWLFGQSVTWVVVWALVMLMTLFPDGKLPSDRWRWFPVVSALWIAMVVVADVLAADAVGGMSEVPHPFLNATTAEQMSTVRDVLLSMTALLMLAAVWSLVTRFRRADYVGRRQIAVLAFAVATYAAYVAAALITLPEEAFIVGDSLVFSLIPVSIGVAILRYRLYEIDRVINRTVVYVLVLGVLAGFYGLSVFVLRGLLPGEGDLAVAASTLAVAALFNPLRKRVQGFVDRRFYRSRYDAREVVDGVAERIRDEVDLGILEWEVRQAVSATMQPATATLWIRDSTEQSG